MNNKKIDYDADIIEKMQNKEKKAFLKKIEAELKKLLATTTGRNKLKKAGFKIPKTV